MHIPGLAQAGIAIGAAAGGQHEGGAIIGDQGGRLWLDWRALAVDDIDEIGEAVVDDEFSQAEPGGVRHALQLVHELGRVGLVFGDAGFGERNDGAAGEAVARPIGLLAEADALFGEHVDLVVEALTVGVTHVVGRAAECDEADWFHGALSGYADDDGSLAHERWSTPLGPPESSGGSIAQAQEIR